MINQDENHGDLVFETLAELAPNAEFYRQSVIQGLWSGYGELARYCDKNSSLSVIVKYIQPPSAEKNAHPRGWGGDFAHQRKLRYYQVEQAFYQGYSQRCSSSCRVPKLLAAKTNRQQQVLVLEDLDDAGYFVRPEQVNLNVIKSALAWLANFHSQFIGTSAENLWPTGCYWHLATRPNEFANMGDSELKTRASKIDHELTNAKFQTLVHGDAKLANLCFNHDGSELAAVDFQYVGAGVGVKDVAYFLGSCLAEKELFDYHNLLLDHYFDVLTNALVKAHDLSQATCNQLETEWRDLYPLAWADFHRFLMGWSPEHKKVNRYMAAQTEIALNRYRK
ncbi:DUF1679 domain-containing protein [Endozoicomonas sp. G2_1]|uniref:oxidoreductase family protein n=1 Tax=Endozoicomonas sp. G2_1 TaxID=2821091 RepID=UPI001ADC9366|nr:oxidoreductase family protein [Endozoicomonas sp. G2_1]MBO9491675.1 DUF1679 domain-containing protein [Endozoicomonas sp. G2_1]